jgi:hypothetical protein
MPPRSRSAASPRSERSAASAQPAQGGDAGIKEYSDAGVEKTRALTGMAAVIAGDVAIAVAAILGIALAGHGKAAAASLSQVVSILTSGFTAMATMTTAYFGIKASANTAKSIAGRATGKPPAKVPPEGEKPSGA